MKKALLLLLILIFALSPVLAESPLTYGYTLDGTPVTENVFSGARVVMVNVWATFCGPCINEMPELGKLAAEYAPQDLKIIGLVGDVTNKTSLARALAIIESTDADYLHLLPTQYSGPRFLESLLYYPSTWFLDANGNLLSKEPVVGSKDYNGWKTIIDTYLKNAQ